MAYARAVRVQIAIEDPRHPQDGKSQTFTVYDAEPETVANKLNEEARRNWRVTDINSKRHKRR